MDATDAMTHYSHKQLAMSQHMARYQFSRYQIFHGLFDNYQFTTEVKDQTIGQHVTLPKHLSLVNT